MAAIGDIVVKFIADFGEFATNVTKGVGQLEQFGKKADEISGQINGVIRNIRQAAAVSALIYVVKQVVDELDRLQQKFTQVADQAAKVGVSFERFEELRLATIKSGDGVDDLANTLTRLKGVTDQALQGNSSVIDSLNKLGVTVLDYNGKQRSQEEINRRIAIAFEKMPASIEKTRLEYALLGEAGEKVERQMKLLADSSGDASTRLQGLGVADAVARIKQVEDRLKAAQERFDLLKAAATLPLKADALDGWAASLERLNAAIVANDLTKLRNLLTTLFSTKALLELGWTALTENNPIGKKLEELTKQEADLEAQIAKGPQKGFAEQWFGGKASEKSLETLKDKLADVRVEIGRLKAAQFDPRTNEGAFQVPVTEQPGRQPPKIGSGAGGRSDAETIAALQARYEKMRDAALEAAKAVRSNIQVDADDLALMVEAKQAAAEAMARIEAKGIKVDPKDLERLEQTIFLAKQAQAEQQRELQYAKQAEDTQRRLGDGTEARNRALRDLNRQLASGRLQEDAYRRAVKESTEATEQAARQAKRYDDDLGSLVAGVEYAAQSYARSKDLFTQGGQVFNTFTTAMGEGLDVLLGKSNKTFGQIAADFASMLAKMALQAAVSQVFKYVFGAIAGSSFGNTAITGETVPDYLIADRVHAGGRAAGGDVYPDQSYTVGEFGPERFIPKSVGRIEPAGSNGMGGNVTVNLDMGQTQGARDPSAALEFGRRVRAAVVDVISQEKRPGGTLYARMR